MPLPSGNTAILENLWSDEAALTAVLCRSLGHSEEHTASIQVDRSRRDHNAPSEDTSPFGPIAVDRSEFASSSELPDDLPRPRIVGTKVPVL